MSAHIQINMGLRTLETCTTYSCVGWHECSAKNVEMQSKGRLYALYTHTDLMFSKKLFGC